MPIPATGAAPRSDTRPEPPAGAAVHAAVEDAHRAARELRARHLGRFPVLAERVLRDADSAREFAGRLASSPAEEDLARGARAFLEALLFDARELLRQRGLRQWSPADLRAMEVRAAARRAPGRFDPARFGSACPESAANAVICLVQLAVFLLDDRRLRLPPAPPERILTPFPSRLVQSTP